MLNQTGVYTASATTRKTILVDEMNSTAFSIVVASTGVDADDDGKKIIKAGTPVTGSLEARNTPFTVTDAADAVGVVLHDVDVTPGQANSQVVVFGFIDLTKLDADVVAMLTPTVRGGAGMNMIKFVK